MEKAKKIEPGLRAFPSITNEARRPMARKIIAPTTRPAYFVHEPLRDSWQLLTGIGNPITSPRREADDAWRAAVLSLPRPIQDSARVRCSASGQWIGTVDASGAFHQAEKEPTR
jgi:hypothetical protein